MDELEALIVLNSISQLSSVKIRSLIERFGSALGIVNACREEVITYIGIKALEDLEIALDKRIGKLELEKVESSQTTVISFMNPHYPKRLLEISDFPVLVYVQGKLQKEDQRCVAIIGTRQASIYGLETAKKMGRELANAGYTIVSGLARGVDTAAHQGALQGGRTLGILGSGLLRPYPQENVPLMQDIKKQGAILSEFSMEASPQRYHFPQRNRIVSGMTQGTIVIEAPLKSGAMLTAEQATRQGRPLFCLPGRVDQENHRGNHLLIKKGDAKLVESAEDIVQFFDDSPLPLTFNRPKSPQIALEKEESELLHQMPIQEISVEELAIQIQWPIGKLNGLLMSLVLKKMIKEYPGKIYKKV